MEGVWFWKAPIGSARLVKLLHTTSNLSMLATSVSPLCSIIFSGMGPLRIVHVTILHKSNNSLNVNPNF